MGGKEKSYHTGNTLGVETDRCLSTRNRITQGVYQGYWNFKRITITSTWTFDRPCHEKKKVM